MKCPNCGSEHVQFATHTKSKSFSLSDSCCGFILLGPLGILCGLCGASSSTKEFWICHDCGHKFSTEKGREHLDNLRRKEMTYQQYKAELDSLYLTEGDYTRMRESSENAQNNFEAVKARKTQILEEFLMNPSPQIHQSAKVLLWTWMAKVSCLLVFCGIAFAGLGLIISFFATDFILKLGLFLFVVGIIVMILFFVIDNYHEKRLMAISLEYRAVLEDESNAKKEKERYENLTKKISFIEAYEAQSRSCL